MDAAQTNKFAMFSAVAALLSDSNAPLSSLPALVSAAAELRVQLNAIPVLMALQQQPTSGVTADKAGALATMAEATGSKKAGV